MVGVIVLSIGLREDLTHFLGLLFWASVVSISLGYP